MNVDQVLEAAVKALPGAEIEVRIDRWDSALTRFANSYIHQNVAEQTMTAGLRVHLNGRTVGVTTTTGDLTALVERAKAAIVVAPMDPAWPGLAPVRGLTEMSTVDDSTVAATPADRAAIVHDFVRAAGGLMTAGYCRTAHWAGSFRNTAGQAIDAAATDAAFDGIARLDGADAVARRSSARLSEMDGAVLGDRAATSVRSLVNPVELEPGRYEVVLMPEATADILNNLAMYGFNGRLFADGRSFAAPGSTQFDSAITIVDDPFSGGRPYDIEGTPRTRLTLVDKGVTTAVAHDRRTGAEVGLPSTGHAFEDSSFGPMPVNLGFAAGPSTVEEMVASVERGILVADFWYTRVLDPRTLVLTGLTRNGAWLIENGKVTQAVRNFRFTQAYPQALAPGQVLGVGAEVVPQPNRRDLVCSAAVALHLASWSFTGGASG